MSAITDGAKHEVRKAARKAAPWVEKLARAGYFSRGFVYVVVGLIAGRAALYGRHPTASRGAMLEVAHQPLGRVVLFALALGLLGYAAWRAVQSVLDPERKGTKLKGLGKRAAYLFTAFVYVGLAAAAVKIALSGSGPGDRTSAGQWTAPVMRHPLGRWAIAAVGVWIAGYGAWLLYRSVAREPEKKLDLYGLRLGVQKAFKLAGRIGIASRAVVFGVIGVWMVRAAWHHRPGETKMPAGALETVREQPHGHWLLAVVAVGLAAFGFFEMVKARYRIIQPAP
ncbi:MAG: DUF1206 domain-containing protein [Longimicrobiaceae bacterium]